MGEQKRGLNAWIRLAWVFGVVIAASLAKKVKKINCENDNCNNNDEPVCSTNGNNFRNRCQMECWYGEVFKHNGVCTARDTIKCPKDYDPVCGYDGKTYMNGCQATINEIDIKMPGRCEDLGANPCANAPKAAQCGVNKWNYPSLCAAQLANITIAAEGTCSTFEEVDDCECNKNYAPVCGKDKQTYGNNCLAYCAKVEVDYKGVCKKTDEECGCSMTESPVCGLDEQTYKNACLAECRYVVVDYEGPCQKNIETCICNDDYSPVCGSDNITYDSKCSANCAGVSIKNEGSCLNSSKKNTAAMIVLNHNTNKACLCPNNRDKVCGEDGVTYDNFCMAECAGNKNSKKGACMKVGAAQ